MNIFKRGQGEKHSRVLETILLIDGNEDHPMELVEKWEKTNRTRFISKSGKW